MAKLKAPKVLPPLNMGNKVINVDDTPDSEQKIEGTADKKDN